MTARTGADVPAGAPTDGPAPADGLPAADDGPVGDGPVDDGPVGDSAAQGLPPGLRTIRNGPALIVVGIVAVVAGGGFALAALGGGPGSQALPRTATHLRGVSLAAVPASGVLRSVVRGGEPPNDIAGAIVVPAGTRRTRSDCGTPVSLYDCSVTLAAPARPSQVITFYRAELRHAGWQILAVDATAGPGNGTAIYAQKGSSDGFYWDVEVRIDSATPSITPALSGGSQSAPTSTVSLRVFERNDAD